MFLTQIENMFTKIRCPYKYRCVFFITIYIKCDPIRRRSTYSRRGPFFLGYLATTDPCPRIQVQIQLMMLYDAEEEDTLSPPHSINLEHSSASSILHKLKSKQVYGMWKIGFGGGLVVSKAVRMVILWSPITLGEQSLNL